MWKSYCIYRIKDLNFFSIADSRMAVFDMDDKHEVNNPTKDNKKQGKHSDPRDFYNEPNDMVPLVYHKTIKVDPIIIQL